MEPVSIRQYEKIFGASGTAHNKSMQSAAAPVDKLHYSLCSAVKRVITLKLDDEEFDAPQINVDNLDSYSSETLYGVMTRKFGRMVQIVQEDETEIEKLSDENVQLKQKLAEMIKYSEQLVSKAREEVQQLLENNTKIYNENNLGKSDIQNMESLLTQKEDEIHKMVINQKQIIDEFVQIREKHHEMNARSEEFKAIIADLKINVEETEARVEEYENLCFDRQKELENLNKQRKVLETKLKQNILKLNNIASGIKKKSSEEDKRNDEFKRIMEKNSLFVKKIAELEKEKDLLKQEIAQKTDELTHVRSLNEDYEQRSNPITGIDNYMRLEQDRYYKLKAEGELLKQQINELAPHSLLDITSKPEQALDGAKRDSAEADGTLIDEEKYANMSPEEIQKEIDMYKAHLQQNQTTIEEFEDSNNQRVEELGEQRILLDKLQNEYTNKVQTYNLAKTDYEDAKGECNQLEAEMDLLISRFNLLSEILYKNGDVDENNEYDDDADEEFHDANHLASNGGSHKMTFGQESPREEYSPKPVQLHVSPSRKEQQSIGQKSSSQQKSVNNAEEEEESDDDREILKKRPKASRSGQKQSPNNSSSKKR